MTDTGLAVAETCRLVWAGSERARCLLTRHGGYRMTPARWHLATDGFDDLSVCPGSASINWLSCNSPSCAPVRKSFGVWTTEGRLRYDSSTLRDPSDLTDEK